MVRGFLLIYNDTRSRKGCSMNQIFLRAALAFFLFVFALPFILSNKNTAPRQLQGNAPAAHAVVKAGDFAPGQLQAHFLKHGYQFGAISEHEYLEDARKLLNADAASGVLAKTRENGDILHYNPKTREFAVMTAEGRIRTYFIADDNYWNKQ